MASSFDSTLSSLGINRNTVSQTALSSSNSGTLGQADFLKLITAQLQNQDPFNPVDNTQQIAQLAQFSQLSGINDINTTLKAISDKLAGTSANDALAYVGRTVLTAGDTAYPRNSGGIAGAVELDGDATDVKVSIQSTDGQVLKTVSLGAHAKGTVDFDWDGTTDAGEQAGPGPYKIAVTAQNAGSTVVSRSLVWAPVESVSKPSSGAPILSVTGIGPIDVSAIRRVG